MMRKLLSATAAAAWVRLLLRLKADKRGGVLMITGFALIPLTFAVGFGIDYARAMSLQTQLDAAADAAALAAVAPSMILQSNTASTSAANAMFSRLACALNIAFAAEVDAVLD